MAAVIPALAVHQSVCRRFAHKPATSPPPSDASRPEAVAKGWQPSQLSTIAAGNGSNRRLAIDPRLAA